MRSNFLFGLLLGAGAALILSGGAQVAAAATKPAASPPQPPTPRLPQIPKSGIAQVDALSAKVEQGAAKYLTRAAPFLTKANDYLAALQANYAAKGQAPTGMASPTGNFRLPGGLPDLGSVLGG